MRTIVGGTRRGPIVMRPVFLLVLMVAGIFIMGFSGFAEADETLAEQYAPLLYFEAEETCFPVSVAYHLENARLYRYTEGESELIDESPTAEEIALYSPANSQYQDTNNFYLDNILGTISDDNIITHYQQTRAAWGYTVYYRVFTQGSQTILQYWMFYAFNKGELNQHEGDWEMVQVQLEQGVPTKVMVSQHYSGQQASWNQVERDDTHVKIYVARGSHANYLRSYSGMMGGSDRVGANGVMLSSSEYTLEQLQGQGWLNFAGRWGEYHGPEDDVRGRAGPFGPMYRANGQMWSSPSAWGASLPMANDIVFLVEWFLYYFIVIFIVVTATSLTIIALRIYRRHKRTGLGPRIVSLLYIDGINLKSIGNVLCIVGLITAILGLLNVWYFVSLGVTTSELQTEGMVDLIVVDGIEGVKVNLLESNSQLVQFSSFSLPFSLILALGLVFLLLATIGIAHSRLLGRKYLYRGIQLLIPVLLIIVVFMSLGAIPLGSNVAGGDSVFIKDILTAIANAPAGGQTSLALSDLGETSQVDVHWGLGAGSYLLLVSGFILLISGILEMISNTQLFTQKTTKKTQSPHDATGMRMDQKVDQERGDDVSVTSGEDDTQTPK
jgi:hypothetical protein